MWPLPETWMENVQKIIAMTPLARKKSELRKLAKLPKDQQKKVATKIKAGKAKTVSEALAPPAKPTDDWNKLVESQPAISRRRSTPS